MREFEETMRAGKILGQIRALRYLIGGLVSLWE